MEGCEELNFECWQEADCYRLRSLYYSTCYRVIGYMRDR